MPVVGDTARGIDIGFKSSSTYIWHACPGCGKQRWVQVYKLRNHSFSGLCRGCIRRKELSPSRTEARGRRAWKGGRIKKDGYILILLQPSDFFYPMVNNHGYVREHRLIMAKHLKRCLHPWEIVHHKGTRFPSGSVENRSDNRMENLQLVTDDRHNQITILETRIKQLEKRVTLLEAENALLRSERVPRFL